MSADGDWRLPVALLHGWGGSFGSTFAKTGLPGALTRIGCDILPIDLPGHGEPPLSHDSDDYSDLAGAVLAMLPNRRVDIVGFSLGAKLALDMALREPERFGTIIAAGIGDNIFAPEPVSGDAIHWLSAADRSGAPEGLKAVIDGVVGEGRDPLALAAVLGRVPNPVFDEDRLSTLRAPLFLITGECDTVAGSQARLLEALPDAISIKLAGIGHFDLPASTLFADTICDVLTRASTKPARYIEHGEKL
jgi:pimeloyl-ACP methyl ester carboxylesterase